MDSPCHVRLDTDDLLRWGRQVHAQCLGVTLDNNDVDVDLFVDALDASDRVLQELADRRRVTGEVECHGQY